jgi:hypothetical protein
VRTTFSTDRILEFVDDEVQRHGFCEDEYRVRWHHRELKGTDEHHETIEGEKDLYKVSQTYRFKGVFYAGGPHRAHTLTAVIRFTCHKKQGRDSDGRVCNRATVTLEEHNVCNIRSIVTNCGFVLSKRRNLISNPLDW